MASTAWLAAAVAARSGSRHVVARPTIAEFRRSLVLTRLNLKPIAAPDDEVTIFHRVVAPYIPLIAQTA